MRACESVFYQASARRTWRSVAGTGMFPPLFCSTPWVNTDIRAFRIFMWLPDRGVFLFTGLTLRVLIFYVKNVVSVSHKMFWP